MRINRNIFFELYYQELVIKSFNRNCLIYSFAKL